MNKPESAPYATISNTKFKNLVLRATVVDYVAEKELKLTIVAQSENLDIILRGGKHCDNVAAWVSKRFNIPVENLVVTSISLGKKFWSPIWKAREAEKREKIKAEKAAAKKNDDAKNDVKNDVTEVKKDGAAYVRKDIFDNTVRPVTIISMPDFFGGTEKKNDDVETAA